MDHVFNLEIHGFAAGHDQTACSIVNTQSQRDPCRRRAPLIAAAHYRGNRILPALLLLLRRIHFFLVDIANDLGHISNVSVEDGNIARCFRAKLLGQFGGVQNLQRVFDFVDEVRGTGHKQRVRSRVRNDPQRLRSRHQCVQASEVHDAPTHRRQPAAEFT